MSVNLLSDKLNEAIERLLESMAKKECDSGEYAKMADQLTKLYKAKDLQESIQIKADEMINRCADVEAVQELKRLELEIKREELRMKRRVSADTWAVVAANIAGIVIIIGYERVGIITSKAVGFIRKLN